MVVSYRWNLCLSWQDSIWHIEQVIKGRLMPTAKEWAEVICQAASLAVKAAKEAMIKDSSMTLDDGLRLENSLNAYLMATEDFTEGTTAFTEKPRRKAVFKEK